MKGVVLAGGLGTRLGPMTQVANKHVLDLFDEPMIHFPMRTLARAGVDRAGRGRRPLRRPGADGAGRRLRDWACSIAYAHQEGEAGIADALAQARPHVGDDRIVAILGDNLYQDDLRPYVEAFRAQPAGARILLKQVEDARRFGVATVDGRPHHRHRGEAVRAPQRPRRDRLLHVRRRACSTSSAGLEPSARGELEITDVNNAYVARGEMAFDVLPGWWTDAGTHASQAQGLDPGRPHQGRHVPRLI